MNRLCNLYCESVNIHLFCLKTISIVGDFGRPFGLKKNNVQVTEISPVNMQNNSSERSGVIVKQFYVVPMSYCIQCLCFL